MGAAQGSRLWASMPRAPARGGAGPKRVEDEFYQVLRSPRGGPGVSEGRWEAARSVLVTRFPCLLATQLEHVERSLSRSGVRSFYPFRGELTPTFKMGETVAGRGQGPVGEGSRRGVSSLIQQNSAAIACSSQLECFCCGMRWSKEALLRRGRGSRGLGVDMKLQLSRRNRQRQLAAELKACKSPNDGGPPLQALRPLRAWTLVVSRASPSPPQSSCMVLLCLAAECTARGGVERGSGAGIVDVEVKAGSGRRRQVPCGSSVSEQEQRF